MALVGLHRPVNDEDYAGFGLALDFLEALQSFVSQTAWAFCLMVLAALKFQRDLTGNYESSSGITYDQWRIWILTENT